MLQEREAAAALTSRTLSDLQGRDHLELLDQEQQLRNELKASLSEALTAKDHALQEVLAGKEKVARTLQDELCETLGSSAKLTRAYKELVESMAATANRKSSLREELKSVRADLHAQEGRIRDQEQERSVVE